MKQSSSRGGVKHSSSPGGVKHAPPHSGVRHAPPHSGAKQPPPHSGAKHPSLPSQRPPNRPSPRSRSRVPSKWLLAGGGTAVVAVVLLVIALIATSATNHHSSTTGSAPTVAVSATLLADLDGVTPANFATAGSSAVGQGLSGSIVPISKPLTASGKPEILYVGAGYCPFCAAFRWGFVVALARFGTWTGLDQNASSPYDSYANTPTLSLANASYSSPYVIADSVEIDSNVCTDLVGKQCGAYGPLQSLTSSESALLAVVDAPPYFRQSDAIPFTDWGGKYVQSGSPYSPQILAGMTPSQVGASLAHPTTAPGQAILQSANIYTAMICALDGGQPGSVCSTAAVSQAGSYLPHS